MATKTTTPTFDEEAERARHAELAAQARSAYQAWQRSRDIAANHRRTSSFQTFESRRGISDDDEQRYQDALADAEQLDRVAQDLLDAYQELSRRLSESTQRLREVELKRRSERDAQLLDATTYRVLRGCLLAGKQRQPSEVINAADLVESGVTPSRTRHLEALGVLKGLYGPAT